MTSLEVNGTCPACRAELHSRGFASDREYPLLAPLNCTVIARPGHVSGDGPRALLSQSGDTGDTCPRSLSPKIVPVSAGQPIFGDSGDSENTFRHIEAVRLVDDP
jgi:hypothetical protein